MGIESSLTECRPVNLRPSKRKKNQVAIGGIEEKTFTVSIQSLSSNVTQP